MGTSIRFFSSVNGLMLDQVVLFPESFHTNLADLFSHLLELMRFIRTFQHGLCINLQRFILFLFQLSHVSFECECSSSKTD